MIKGTVKWFKNEKGYGFITREDGKGDVFVHHSAINSNGFRTLEQGQVVTFECVPSDKGEKAINVTVITQ